MIDFTSIYGLLHTILPSGYFEERFMQQALLALLLLAPTCAMMGIHILNFKMAFFTDAIAHSTFTGVAIGIIAAINPNISILIFAMLTAILIVMLQRKTDLSTDTTIGVSFAAIIAFGLAIVSREKNTARAIQRFVYGDILMISDWMICVLALLMLLVIAFEFFFFNKLIYTGISQTLAGAHKINVGLFQYIFAILLAAVVVSAVWSAGVFLVTALMIVPAATARNLAGSLKAMFWWAIIIAVFSSIMGLAISAQDWAQTATGATVVLVNFGCFVISVLIKLAKR
jgi:zinc transport system permease protein